MSLSTPIDIKVYLLAHNLDGIVRIPQEEYGGFPTSGFLTHFNLEKTNVAIGKHYALPRILKYGYKTAHGEELLPELSFDAIYLGECIEVVNNLSYGALTSNDFVDSFTHIKNADELKTYIVKRYTHSKPDVSADELINLGVSRMRLRLYKGE